MNLAQLLIVVAIALFVWGAFVIAGWVDYGTVGFLGFMGAASFAAGHLVYSNREIL